MSSACRDVPARYVTAATLSAGGQDERRIRTNPTETGAMTTDSRAIEPGSRLVMRTRPGQSLSRQVADHLIERIGQGEFEPGDKLPGELDLMAQYGVGRNTAREAVQGLVALRMLDVRPRRGATVLTVSPDRALPKGTLSALLSRELTDDLYEMRLLLETEAAGRAAARHNPRELQEIRHHHERMRHQISRGMVPWKTDLQFHDAIARACGNSVLPIMLESASDLLARDRQAASRLHDENVHEALDEHEAVLVAIEEGDPAAARRLMGEHIRTASGYVARLRALRDGDRDEPHPGPYGAADKTAREADAFMNSRSTGTSAPKEPE